jgi:uncharacterized protein (DUF1778 family)
MPAEKFERTERLEARVSPEVKLALLRAAQLQGRSLTDFLVAAGWEAALRVIAEHQLLQLDRVETEVLLQILLEPPAPNADLFTAAQRYNKLFLELNPSDS